MNGFHDDDIQLALARARAVNGAVDSTDLAERVSELVIVLAPGMLLADADLKRAVVIAETHVCRYLHNHAHNIQGVHLEFGTPSFLEVQAQALCLSDVMDADHRPVGMPRLRKQFGVPPRRM